MILNIDKEETIGVLESLQAVCNAKADMSIGKGKILWAGYGKAVGDAIVVLKEQKAKPMIENERGWNCPSCGMNLIGKSASGYPCYLIDLPEDEPIHFCPMCGQAVKWE